MNEIVKVNYEGNRPTVMGRDLHEALEVKTSYKDWFPRMCEYGFVENQDFCSILSESTGGRPSINHQLTIEMAKELCMIQRTEKGKLCRQYFLELEKAWNSPEAVMARALQFANEQLSIVRKENKELLDTVAVQGQQIAELTPKATYYDVILACKDALPITAIAKDFGWSGKKMNQYLADKKIQFKQSGIWLLYQKYAELGYTCTKTHVHTGSDGMPHSTVHTYWTQKGRIFIYQLLKSDGHLPTMEQ